MNEYKPKNMYLVTKLIEGYTADRVGKTIGEL